MKKCKVENCNKDMKSYKTYCPRHYCQLWSKGVISKNRFDENRIIEYADYVELELNDKSGNKFTSYCDKLIYDKIKLFRWTPFKSKKSNVIYARANAKNGKNEQIFMHHIILPRKKGYVSEHINGNGLDNRSFNLRYATHSQNHLNVRMYSSNTSGVKGVHFNKANNKWMAFLKTKEKFLNLGHFERKEDATIARREAEKKYFGEFSYSESQKLAAQNV